MYYNFTDEQLIDAISKSGAIMSNIADRLGCNWHTANTAIKKSEAASKALEDEREKRLDKAEDILMKSIESGDTGDAKWLLSKIGKHRGYGDTVDIRAGIQIVKIDGDDENL